jgi:hypothetical protein
MVLSSTSELISMLLVYVPNGMLPAPHALCGVSIGGRRLCLMTYFFDTLSDRYAISM